MNLSQALRLSDAPCLALVGAGGKTSALFQLARELPRPVIVTATTHLAAHQVSLADKHLVVTNPEDIAALEGSSLAGVILLTGAYAGDRTTGLPNDILLWLCAYCNSNHIALLIEADGSRQRPLKAPGEGEPPIPDFVDIVVVVAGLSALGKPLSEDWVHRVEEFRRISESANQRGGESAGQQVVTVEMVAKVLMHPQGGLKNIPANARRVALLNQADTAELQAQAKALAEGLLSAYHAVVIASLQQFQIHAVYEPVAGIILAAGEAKRFGQPKQLLDYRGQPFVHAVAQTALKAGLAPVIVVTGANAEPVEAALKDLPVQIIQNVDWQSGQSSSIRAGLCALPPPSLRDTSPISAPLSSPHFEVQKWGDRGGQGGREGVGAAIFLLADQPQVTPTVLRALVERHAQDLAPILAPLVQGQRANPVLFDRVTFPDLLALSGDVGGRAIFSKHPVTYLPWLDASLLLDIDTPDDYQKLGEKT
ncbi:MAG: putative selenium-dependent hydroxylase accessory protein YqeC [Anaerolinea sp.]|nr:putative selenium-dependent hydroxylase accessory protein YqeC [Anaerolinea sp.]